MGKALEAVIALQRDAKAGTVRTLEEEKRFTSLVRLCLLSIETAALRQVLVTTA